MDLVRSDGERHFVEGKGAGSRVGAAGILGRHERLEDGGGGGQEECPVLGEEPCQSHQLAFPLMRCGRLLAWYAQVAAATLLLFGLQLPTHAGTVNS